MQVTSATTPTTSGTTATTTGAPPTSTVDYNTFLKLLVAELQNQDPTSPTDPTQYLSQLASFSAVGQGVQTNAKLDTVITSSALTQAEAAIGRTVTSADGQTSGLVTAVAIGQGGAVTATLANGQTLALGNGVTVGAPAGTAAGT